MKNSKMTYLLVLLVAIIWGIILYRIFQTTRSGTIPSGNGSNNLSLSDTSLRNSFSVKANYRDPFLDNYIPRKPMVTAKPSAEKPHTKVIVSPEPQKVVLPWPSIRFSGMISDRSGTKKVALVSINGKENTIREGQYFNDIKLVSVTRDSIQIMYLQEKRTFARAAAY